MADSDIQQFVVNENTAGAILSALRQHLSGASWSVVRRLLGTRRIAINGALCLDEGRRVTVGEIISVHVDSLPLPPTDKDVTIHWLDQWLVVAEKPAGMISLRHPAEQSWSQARRDLQPTLDECVIRLVRKKYVRSRQSETEILHSIHRIDRDTSGLLVFARNEQTQAKLIEQFAAHEAVRRYLCVIPGELQDQTIRTHFIRDRGDGLRGSGSEGQTGTEAITHIRTLRRHGDFSELECRLETGRTNQIRIHLAELGHPVCGDIKYRGPLGVTEVPDLSHAPRLALHATELGFIHPDSNETLRFETPWPPDMQRFIRKLSPETAAAGLPTGHNTESHLE